MGKESLQAIMQICLSLGQSNGGPWSKDRLLEEPYVGQKWLGSGTSAMLVVVWGCLRRWPCIECCS